MTLSSLSRLNMLFGILCLFVLISIILAIVYTSRDNNNDKIESDKRKQKSENHKMAKHKLNMFIPPSFEQRAINPINQVEYWSDALSQLSNTDECYLKADLLVKKCFSGHNRRKDCELRLIKWYKECTDDYTEHVGDDVLRDYSFILEQDKKTFDGYMRAIDIELTEDD